MLILTGVNLQSNRVEVLDTDDGSNERTSLSVLISKLGGMNTRIYGLRLFSPLDFYPPDARRIPGTDAVIIPSEAQRAYQNIANNRRV